MKSKTNKQAHRYRELIGIARSRGWVVGEMGGVECGSYSQSCPALCNSMDSRLPGSSVRGISQARILEWVTISSSRGSFQPRGRTHASYLAGILCHWAFREAPTSNLQNQKSQGWGLGVCIFRSLQFCKLCLRASLVAQLVKNPPAMQKTWVGKIQLIYINICVYVLIRNCLFWYL